MTVLTWLQSESCKYKVFVGTRVAEVQEWSDAGTWRYVESADDINVNSGPPQLDVSQYNTFQELLEAAACPLHGAASETHCL